MLLDEILNEARFRKPRIMYHGTTEQFLRTILKQGLIPNPTKKRWEDDEDHNIHSFSRKSLLGSYWTSNLMTAISSATNTNRKYPGESIIVIGQIAEQSAYADEDSVNSPIMFAMGDTNAQMHPGIRRDFWMAMADDVFGNDEAKRKKAQSIFVGYLHEYLKGHVKHQPDSRLVNELLDILVMRSIVYEKKNGMRLEHWMTNVPEELPSIAEVEAKLLAIRDRVTRSYRATASYKDGDYNHTLRMANRVGYSGGSKIVSIVKIPPWRWEVGEDGEKKTTRDPLILMYGTTVPDDFVKQYKERVGSFPGLVDKKGKMIMPRSEKEY